MTVVPRPMEPSSAAAAEVPPTYEAHALLAGGTRARIVLEDRAYTLSLTRAGKLILTR